MFLGVAIGLGLLSKFSFIVFFPPAVLVVLILQAPSSRARRDTRCRNRDRIPRRLGRLPFRRRPSRGRRRARRRHPRVGGARTAQATRAPARAHAHPRAGDPGRHGASEAARDRRPHRLPARAREPHGWWYYFPVVFFYKSPLPFLILVAWGAVLLARDRRGLQIVLIPVAILLTAMTASLNIGARHILPIIPPLSIVAGYAVVHIWRTSRDAFGRAALIALLAWLFIGVGKEHPDYLPWFNEAAQPNPSWVAADSNVDWGQDVLRLARVVEELQIDHLHSAFMNSMQLDRHGIHATGLKPRQKVSRLGRGERELSALRRGERRLRLASWLSARPAASANRSGSTHIP